MMWFCLLPTVSVVMSVFLSPQFLGSGREFVTRKHDGDKLISFERGGLVWVLNFHPSQSFVDYRIAVERAGR